MKTTIAATYRRESILWKNANAFYHMQDWTLMECILVDYTEDLTLIKSGEFRFIDSEGNDITDREVEKRYGKPYLVKFTNKRKTNSKCYWFKTKEEANTFVLNVKNDKILRNFKRIK